MQRVWGMWAACDSRACCRGLVDVMVKFVVELANKSHLRW